MKKVIVSILMMAASGAIFGKTVDEQTAQTVAYNFLKAKVSLASQKGLALAYTGSSVLNGVTVADFYVFNNVSGNGFILVSADDGVMPVLGYSTESNFEANHINASVQYLLDNYKMQIAYEIQNNINAQSNVAEKWASLKAGNSVNTTERTTYTFLPPMLHTIWDQENPLGPTITYNADCPYDANAGRQTITGCVATAMSQVMKYWNWPDTGVGSHSYTQYPNPDGLAGQSANFAVAFGFDSMPGALTAPNAYVAKLMHFAGVSVNMDYGTDAEGGSGAFVTIGMSPIENCAEYALREYFRYPTAKGYQRYNFDQTSWIDTMLNEMISGRPVIYAGDGADGGHCWVMDGADDDSFFHFNWGWNGSYDGYYTVNNLAPGTGETFNNDQEAIVRIMVDTATPPPAINTGVKQVTAAVGSINIFPDPAVNEVNVSLDGYTAKEIIITDIAGREVKSVIPIAFAKTVVIPFTDLPAGDYILRALTGQGILIQKFAVVK